jgi:hypothetical protein
MKKTMLPIRESLAEEESNDALPKEGCLYIPIRLFGNGIGERSMERREKRKNAGNGISGFVPHLVAPMHSLRY